MNVFVHAVKYKAVGSTRALSHRDHHTVTHRVTVALSLCHQCRHAVTHRWRNTHSQRYSHTATQGHCHMAERHDRKTQASSWETFTLWQSSWGSNSGPGIIIITLARG